MKPIIWISGSILSNDNDGVLLSGGYDFDPIYWCEEIHS